MTRGDQDIQVVVFGLGEEEFGLPVASVREILDHRTAYRVPNAPAWFLGLTDVRGLSVPMVDLRVRLGLMPAEATLATRILVVDVPTPGGEPLSLGLWSTGCSTSAPSLRTRSRGRPTSAAAGAPIRSRRSCAAAPASSPCSIRPGCSVPKVPTP